MFYAIAASPDCQADNANLAAMVFEEAASHKPPSSDTWTDGSALTPKVPAPPDVSPSNAQTHRLSIPASEAPPVPCPKEPVHLSTGFDAEDASPEIRCKSLKAKDQNFP